MENFDSNIFCDRAIKLFGEMGQMELSEKIGISQGVISAIKNRKVKAPGADTVFRIAKSFGVSADYLLSLSDAPTTDADLRAVCDYTGLSQIAIEKIIGMKHEEDAEKIEKNESMIDLLSTFIESGKFWNIFYSFKMAESYAEYLDADNAKRIVELARNRMDGKEIISQQNSRLLYFIYEHGLEPTFKQILVDTIWEIFEEVVKHKNEQKP